MFLADTEDALMHASESQFTSRTSDIFQQSKIHLGGHTDNGLTPPYLPSAGH